MRSHQNYLNKNQSRAVRELLLKALLPLKSNALTQAIDLGCGLGIETGYLASAHNWSVLAIDNDSELLDMAKTKINSSQENRVEFLNLPFESIIELPACDLLYSYHSLHFIDRHNYERFWQLLLSIIKPDGVIALSLFATDDYMVTQKHAIGISEDELKNRLAGFKIIYFQITRERGQKILSYFDVIAVKT